jgi:hypothetical protein
VCESLCVCAGGSQRACTTMAECKKQVLDNFAGEFDGVVKQTQEKKKKKTLGSRWRRTRQSVRSGAPIATLRT